MIEHNVEKVLVDILTTSFVAHSVSIPVLPSVDDLGDTIVLPAVFIHAELQSAFEGRKMIYRFDVTVKLEELIPEQTSNLAKSTLDLIESTFSSSSILPSSLSAFQYYAIEEIDSAKVSVMGERRDSSITFKVVATES